MGAPVAPASNSCRGEGTRAPRRTVLAPSRVRRLAPPVCLGGPGPSVSDPATISCERLRPASGASLPPRCTRHHASFSIDMTSRTCFSVSDKSTNSIPARTARSDCWFA